MDLIKNYGSYENAKAELEKVKSTKYRNYMYLEEALLEYRRANNIFERHDNVVRLDIELSHIYKVHEIYECESIGIVRHQTATKPHWTVLAPWHIRHATQEEIAAGHRL